MKEEEEVKGERGNEAREACPSGLRTWRCRRTSGGRSRSGPARPSGFIPLSTTSRTERSYTSRSYRYFPPLSRGDTTPCQVPTSLIGGRSEELRESDLEDYFLVEPLAPAPLSSLRAPSSWSSSLRAGMSLMGQAQRASEGAGPSGPAAAGRDSWTSDEEGSDGEGRESSGGPGLAASTMLFDEDLIPSPPAETSTRPEQVQENTGRLPCHLTVASFSLTLFLPRSVLSLPPLCFLSLQKLSTLSRLRSQQVRATSWPQLLISLADFYSSEGEAGGIWAGREGEEQQVEDKEDSEATRVTEESSVGGTSKDGKKKKKKKQ